MRRYNTIVRVFLVVFLLASALPLAASGQVVSESFSIGFGDTVSDGVPGPGAGNLETGGSEDTYDFSADQGDVAIFDVRSGSTSTFRWRLQAPDGSVLFDAAYTDRSVELSQSGTYSLTVYGTSATATGTYSFDLLLTPAPEMFSISYGETVSDGVPGPGAGNVEVPGSVDVYTFLASAGDTAIFDALDGPTSGLRWKLFAPDGSEEFNRIFNDREADLSQAGTYTLTVSGLTVTGTGVYSFHLALAPGVEDFDIAIGDTVSDGVPEPGAGNLEAPGAVDRYTFEVTTAQTVVLDAISGSTTNVRWRLAAPDGTEIFDAFFVDQQADLLETGTYTLTVEGQGIAGFGAYSFQIVGVPPRADEFAIAFEDTVSDGVPGPGAGQIEGPGAVDVYSFDAVAGQRAIFDTLDGPASGLRWTLVDPNGSEVFDVIYADGAEDLTATGTYTLTVTGLTVTGTGTYSFQLLEAPANRDPVAVDDAADTDAGTAAVIDVLANDSDPDGDALLVDSASQPGNGSATTDGATVTYEPDSGFFGVDTFTYTVVDGAGGSAEATVTVTVHEPPNNPPTIEEIGDQENVEGDDVGLRVGAGDPDGDALVFDLVGLPPGVTFDASSGAITGTIEPGAATQSPYMVEVTVADPDGANATGSFLWVVTAADADVTEVEIDLPLSCLFVNGFGVIPVVIHGSAEIDVRNIDLGTVTLEGMPVVQIWTWYAATYKEIDRDGYLDVLVLIDEERGVLAPGVTTAAVTGEFRDGGAFQGSDDICVWRHRPT